MIAVVHLDTGNAKRIGPLSPPIARLSVSPFMNNALFLCTKASLINFDSAGTTELKVCKVSDCLLGASDENKKNEPFVITTDESGELRFLRANIATMN